MTGTLKEGGLAALVSFHAYYPRHTSTSDLNHGTKDGFGLAARSISRNHLLAASIAP